MCLLFLNQLAKITFVKGTFLIPFLLLLVYLGGFAVNNAFGDMVMVVIFGAVGWLMVRFDWQRPPLLLGLVLGGIAENNLFIATKVYGAGFMLRPGVLVITALIVAGMCYPMFQAYRERKRAERHEAAFEVPGITKTVEVISRNERTANGIFAFCFVALFAYVLRECFFRLRRLRGARRPVPGGHRAAGLCHQCGGLREGDHEDLQSRGARRGGRGGGRGDSPRGNAPANRGHQRLGGGFLPLHLAAGFVLSSVVATFLYLKVGARERWPISIILTLVAYVFFGGIFDMLLHLPFPTGDLFVWLGLE